METVWTTARRGGAFFASAFVALVTFAFLCVGLTIGSPQKAWAENATFEPGTYTITANLKMPGEYNPVLVGVTVFANNPNNPFGPTFDENDSNGIENAAPTSGLTMNAQLIVGEDGSKTLYLPIKNPIFTTQSLGTCADVSNVQVEYVAPTHKLGNTSSYEGSYGSKTSRIHKMTATLSDTATEGTVTYNFKGSKLYAVPLNLELAPSGDIALQLDVDYDSATKSSDDTTIPSLETEKTVVNVPDKTFQTPYSGSGDVTVAYETSAVAADVTTVSTREASQVVYTLKDTDAYVWSDGTSGKQTTAYYVGLAKSPSVLPQMYNGRFYYYATDSFPGIESFSGEWTAKDAGEYTVIAKLKEGYTWDAEGSDTADKSQEWRISKKLIYPQASATIKEGQTPEYELVYKGNEDPEIGLVEGETPETAAEFVAPTPTVSFPSGITNVEDLPAGTYTVSWDGGSAKNYTMAPSWLTNIMYPSTLTVEEADKITVPSAQEGLVYTGAEQQGVADSEAYTLSGEYVATTAGEHVAVVTPKPGYKWTDGTREAKEVTWSIAKATLVATYTGGTMTYGDTAITPSLSYSGFVNGEDETTAAEFVAPVVAAPEGVAANGTYQITPTGGSAKNYTFEYASGTLHVLPLGSASIPSSQTLIYNGDTQSGIPESVAYTISGDASARNVGPYSATVTLNPGYVWADKTTDAKEISWSIAKKVLSARYVSEEVSYGESPAYRVEVTGFASNDSAENAAGYTAPTVSASEALGADSTQTLTPSGGSATNYSFSYVPGTLKVVPLGTIDIPQGKSGLVYNGNEQTGLEDAFEHVTFSGDTATTQVGTYQATAQLDEGYVWSDGTSDNKTIVWSIVKANLVATYEGQTMKEDGVFEGTVTVEGFVNGETAESAAQYVAPVVEAPKSFEAGKSYELKPAGGSAANYEFEYKAGTLQIDGSSVHAASKSDTTTETTTSAATNKASLAQTGDATGLGGAAAIGLAALSVCVATCAFMKKRSK